MSTPTPPPTSPPTSVIVTIEGHRYDVTSFVPNHPGEKPAKNVSLGKYPDQEISQLFAEIHDHKSARKEKARGLLDQARHNGDANGIKYLGSAN
jgi:cytochrome b involved in lipid metabolism